MTKLTELFEQDLSELLGVPEDGARRWLEEARFLSEDQPKLGNWEAWLRDTEPAAYLRHSAVRDLMGLSVEDVERLKRAGRFYRRCPYFRREEPLDPSTRLKYLRDMLADEVEFEARYPAAYELLFEGSRALNGLPLPSFEVRALRSAPKGHVLPAGRFQEWKRAQDVDDAFSVTYERREAGDPEADQEFARLDLGHLRGVLLAVLGREEYAERVATELHDETLREELGAPARSSVRLTDLRLATEPTLSDPATLERRLRPLLESLRRPIAAGRVLEWKRNLLHADEEGRTSGSKEEEEGGRTATLSFAAAALLLFLDLDVPGIESASSLVLTKRIADLAGIVRVISKSLDANARKLEALLAYRAQNRPLAHEQRFYEALVSYRMGEGLEEVARGLGITPYESSPTGPDDSWGGTKHWKRHLRERLERGAAVERRKYPLAAAVFGGRHNPRIEAKARLAYRSFLAHAEAFPPDGEDQSPLFRTGEAIRVRAGTEQGLEVIGAYVQLGSCLEQNRNPFPARSDLDA